MDFRHRRTSIGRFDLRKLVKPLHVSERLPPGPFDSITGLSEAIDGVRGQYSRISEASRA